MLSSQNPISAAFASLVDRGPAPVILQILPTLRSGGVEQGVIDLNAGIVKAGGISIVVSAGGPRAHEIIRAGGQHITLPVHSKNPLVMLANIYRLRHLIRTKKVDIVHACSRAPAWSASRAVKGTTAHYITSCHAAHAATPAIKKYYNTSIAGGERVIAVSHFLADYLEKTYAIDPRLIRVIHRGVPLEKYHPNSVSPERLVKISKAFRIPEGASVIMLPARLTRQKGHMFLLDALKQLGRSDVFCLLVGAEQRKGEYRQELEKYIAAQGLEGMVRIVTDCNDMPAAYMLSTVVVCPSLVPEGFGRVPVEAQAMGRPVIATDHGAVRETIIRDETGWLVPPGDIAALVKTLQNVIGLDARERAVLATQAMSHVAARFTNERMCASTLDVYAELLK